ncbi:hypothetical protein ACWGA9_23725 [Streptomyces sp. NPDC054950]
MRLPLGHDRAELVEVVRIGDPARHLTSRDLAGDVVEVRAGEEVRQLLRLVGELPDSPKYRCFLPGWGIRAYDDTDPEPLFEIAFCFRCNGARLWGRDVTQEQRHQDFEAESAAGRELLRRFRACAPGGDVGGPG